MTDERKPKVIVELREQFHRDNEPTAEEAAEVWRRIAERQEHEERARGRRWAILHAGAAAIRPDKINVADIALWVVAAGFILFATCGGAP